MMMVKGLFIQYSHTPIMVADVNKYKLTAMAQEYPKLAKPWKPTLQGAADFGFHMHILEMIPSTINANPLTTFVSIQLFSSP